MATDPTRLAHRLSVLGLLLVAMLAFGACGSDSDSDSGDDEAKDKRPPVALFDGKPITRAEFDEWYEASVKNSRSGGPGKMMAVVPDPPPYRRCLQGYENRMTDVMRYQGIEVPENECRVAWQSLMGGIMEDLITARWVADLARQRGVELSDEEARKVFDEQYLGTEAAKQEYGDLSYDDLVENLGEDAALARARLTALQLKVSQSGPPLTPEDTRDYRERTTCSLNFLSDMCSNGPKTSSSVRPANPTPPAP